MNTSPCICDSLTGRQCIYHARLPRPCPTIRHTDAGDVPCPGALQRYSGREGSRREPYVSTQDGYVVGRPKVQYRSTSGAFWACNCCEHCE